jgi:hypothetical protein
MSGGGEAPARAPAKSAEARAMPAKDAYVDLAERIFINLSARVYGTLSGTDQKKPDPKALAAFCFKLVDAFEQASNETPRRRAEIEAKLKAGVKLDEIDMSSMFKPTAKPAAAPPAEPAKK